MTPTDGDAPPTAATREAFATTQPGGTATADQDTIVPQVRDSQPIELPAPGYDFGEVIGRGGMGEVVSARDRRIGRDVAIKRMRGERPTDAQVNRFLREARVQARLDHPAIVPVHEMGVDTDNRPYFTMKRLAGVTLAQRMSEHMPLQGLLRAFVDVCLAIEFAHQHRVVHRDLKPANIMLGDYGEVYVLDWGIARVLDSRRPPSHAGTEEATTLDEHTQTGELLGTPGYMAPEQVRGNEIETPTDVYALGTILFEILSEQPLHPRGTAALALTLTQPQQAPAQRVPDREIAPELDATCFAALADDPRARPTARQLADRVQRYLDGDRDTERRRTLADEQLAVARAAYESGDPERRAIALNSAGRALALHPESVDAAQLVTRMMIEPPKEMPADLVAHIATEDQRAASERLRASVFGLLCIMGVLVIVPWLHIRNWTTLGLTVAAVMGTIAWLWWASRSNTVSTVRSIVSTLVLSIAFTRVLGSFVLTPIIISGCLLSITANVTIRKRPSMLVAWLALAAVTPIVLEIVGAFAHTTVQSDNLLCTRSPIFVGQGAADLIALGLANLILLGGMALYGVRINRQVTEARHELQTQAWHLGQLLPAGRISVR